MDVRIDREAANMVGESGKAATDLNGGLSPRAGATPIDEISPRAGCGGPASEAGKAVSSKNALKHGLRSVKPENAVDPATKAQYEALRAEYLNEYKPQGATENTLLDMVMLAVWQLYKVSELELFNELDLGTLGSMGRSEKLARYRAAHERSLHKNLNQLRQIQQERLLRQTDRQAAVPAQLPPAVRSAVLRRHVEHLEKHPKTQVAGAGAPGARARMPYLRRKPIGVHPKVTLVPRP
jgi:hypothetical protein